MHAGNGRRTDGIEGLYCGGCGGVIRDRSCTASGALYTDESGKDRGADGMRPVKDLWIDRKYIYGYRRSDAEQSAGKTGGKESQCRCLQGAVCHQHAYGD